MKNRPLVLFYPSAEGETEIRTFYRGDILYLSLEDVVHTLAKENSRIPANEGRHGFSGLLNAVKDTLDPDEVKSFEIENQANRAELFVTEPGLYRVISHDKSPAAKRFQRWVFHEVLPSIRKYGTFPPPLQQGTSELGALAQMLAQNTSLLVEEIQERERLAKETDLRFKRAESELEKISEQLQALGEEDVEGPFYSVEEYLSDNGISEIDHQHLWGMCNKFCIEEQTPTKKKHKANGQHIYMYPAFILARAVSCIEKSMD